MHDAILGDGGYANGARARQIRDGLFAVEAATPRQMLAIQLDDRALFLERWRELLADVLRNDTAQDPRRQALRELVETGWTGRACCAPRRAPCCTPRRAANCG